jgi:diketogulonate reductase-like aldo/keto reductase
MIETTKKSYRLKSGYEMPVLGLGTWELTGKVCEGTVRKAIDLGYRHIDTAELYGNESEIGRALKGSEREKLFITSKAASKNLGSENLIKACERSLAKLGTDYLDLYLLHWPNDNIPLSETLEAMQQLVDREMIGSAGLSNFDAARVNEALSVSSVPICNLQIEYHPFTYREELPAFCREEGITITAYSPLARGKVFNDPTLRKMAEKYDKTAAQVSLKWLVQKGNIVIPKSSSEEHLRENMEIFDWQLSEADIESINNIRRQERLVDTRYT